MTKQLDDMRRSLRAYPGFAVAVLITLALAGLIGLVTFLMILRPGFLGMAHFSDTGHRVHDLTYGFLFTAAVVGLMAQLRRPLNNVAGLLMALIPWVGLLLVAVLSTSLGVALSAERILVAAGTVTAAALHPARGGLFRSLRIARVNRVMLGVVIVAAVPLIALASTNIGLQRSVADEHAAAGHYGFIAAFSLTVIGVGLLASLRPVGWRLTAWIAGLLPASLGLASVVYPDASSSLSQGWALAAIAWGAAFVAAASLTRDAEALPRPTGVPHGTRDDAAKGEAGVRQDGRPAPRTPRWVKITGIVAGVLILLVVIARVTGIGGQHGAGRHGAASSVAAGAREVAVTANDLLFDPDEISVTTGEDVAIVLTSVDTLHDFTIDELDAHVAADRGETETGGFRVGRPGRYTFYCAVPGHRQAGMEGTLLVLEETG